MSRNQILSVVIIAVATFGGFWFASSPSTPTAPEIQLGAANAQEATPVVAGAVNDMTQGNPEAALTVIEYASFTCPHCASFHEKVYPSLKADYIDTGKINFVYREVYFDLPGLWGSMVARCGAEQRFFGITNLLYERQKEWLASGDRAQIEKDLRKIGKLAGLGEDQLNACLTDEARAKELVGWYQGNAEEHGIRSTPSFVIDGTTYSNMAYSEFRSILDEKLGE